VDKEHGLLWQLLKQFAGTLQATLHPALYAQKLREIGKDLGLDLASQVRPSHQHAHRQADPLRAKQDYQRWLDWVNTQWGGAYRPQFETPHKVRVDVPRCPFKDLATDDPTICQLEAALFGGVAGEYFGYAKVALARGAGTPPRDCRLTLYLERTPEALAQEGLTFGSGPLGAARDQTAAAARRVLAQVTPRERKVLELVAEGLSDREIAAALRVSVRTVEGHMAKIRDKTGIRSRSALVRVVLQANAF
jgi:DNA-binding CsgD family transcriptional regulator